MSGIESNGQLLRATNSCHHYELGKHFNPPPRRRNQRTADVRELDDRGAGHVPWRRTYAGYPVSALPFTVDPPWPAPKMFVWLPVSMESGRGVTNLSKFPVRSGWVGSVCWGVFLLHFLYSYCFVVVCLLLFAYFHMLRVSLMKI